VTNTYVQHTGKLCNVIIDLFSVVEVHRAYHDNSTATQAKR